jgi:copper homeostasis protein CutC
MNKLDRWAARHRVLASAIATAIVFGCLYAANQIDRANTAEIRMQMMASRSWT